MRQQFDGRRCGRSGGIIASAARRGALVWAVIAALDAAGGATVRAGVALSGAERVARVGEILEQLTDADAGHAEELAADESIGRCIALPQFSVLFGGEVSAAWLEAFLAEVPDEALAATYERYQLQGSRWTFTATDGAVNAGEALTLTYSFVPDGTPLPVAGFEGSDPSNLFATLDASFPGGRDAWKARFRAAFDRYEELTNITYVEVADDGAAFPNSAGALGSRGDIRIGMRNLDGNAGTNALAVNFFPQFGGDMVLDSANIGLFTDPTNGFLVLRNVLMHEHGHGLGLRHVIPESETKLMEPLLATAFDGPQEDDIRGVTHLYGDRFEANNALGEEVFVGGPLDSPANAGVQVLTIEEASLERAGESDFYGFTAFAEVPIALRVEPVGTTYEQGPQGGAASTVNARAVRNLGLRLWRRMSAQDNTFALIAQIDFNGAGQAEYHPPIPYQLAGYMVGEIYSTDGVDDSQRYRLRISNAAIESIVDPPSMSVFDVAAGEEIEDGDTVPFGATAIGSSVNRTLTIVNGGPGDLELGAIVVAGPSAGDYGLTLVGSTTVGPGQSRSLAVSFTPSAAGVRAAVLTIPNNDPDQPNFGLILNGAGFIDCNGNGVADGTDIGNGTSADCDGNGVPDECEADGDMDGTIDACDGCPEDAGKTAPGACGCGVAETDSDGDEVPDCIDNCELFNPDQADEDGNGVGDACEEPAEQPLGAGSCGCSGGAATLSLMGLCMLGGVGLVRRPLGQRTQGIQ